MIFPGMDPYLEDPTIWPGIHNRLAINICDALLPHLLPRYVALTGQRVYVQGPSQHGIEPDVWLRRRREPADGKAATAVLEAEAPVEVEAVDGGETTEPFVNVIDRRDGKRVVTVIELLSPSYKYAGVGRDEYKRKQREVLTGGAHLVEIDLLRYGPHAAAVPLDLADLDVPYDYLVSVNRARPPRRKFELYRKTLRQRLPVIRVPLAGNDADVPLDLQAALAKAYDNGAYQYAVRYDRPCRPPLSADDQTWADELIRAATRTNSQ